MHHKQNGDSIKFKMLFAFRSQTLYIVLLSAKQGSLPREHVAPKLVAYINKTSHNSGLDLRGGGIQPLQSLAQLQRTLRTFTVPRGKPAIRRVEPEFVARFRDRPVFNDTLRGPSEILRGCRHQRRNFRGEVARYGALDGFLAI